MTKKTTTAKKNPAPVAPGGTPDPGTPEATTTPNTEEAMATTTKKEAAASKVTHRFKDPGAAMIAVRINGRMVQVRPQDLTANAVALLTKKVGAAWVEDHLEKV